MKGTAMALEYVVKMLILLVVATIVILIIFGFYDDIKIQAAGFFGKEDKVVEAESVEAASFSTSQVRNYIKSCWSMTGEKYKKDTICYFLKGDFNAVNVAQLQNIDGVNAVDLTNFDITKEVTMIRFKDIGDIIVLES